MFSIFRMCNLQVESISWFNQIIFSIWYHYETKFKFSTILQTSSCKYLYPHFWSKISLFFFFIFSKFISCTLFLSLNDGHLDVTWRNIVITLIWLQYRTRLYYEYNKYAYKKLFIFFFRITDDYVQFLPSKLYSIYFILFERNLLIWTGKKGFEFFIEVKYFFPHDPGFEFKVSFSFLFRHFLHSSYISIVKNVNSSPHLSSYRFPCITNNE